MGARKLRSATDATIIMIHKVNASRENQELAWSTSDGRERSF